MNNSKHGREYWEERYANGEVGWDIGSVSRPLKEYIDQLSNKDERILIPGCGNGYEAQYMHEQGFNNVFVIDLAQSALASLQDRTPGFPSQHLIPGDYFTHEGQYNLILEQTFFSSLEPRLRPAYAKKAYDLLVPQGKLSGVLFDFELDSGPPYGGTQVEYEDTLTTISTYAPSTLVTTPSSPDRILSYSLRLSAKHNGYCHSQHQSYFYSH